MPDAPFTPMSFRDAATLADILYLDNYGDRWCSRIYNLENVLRALGDDVLVHFCRCFIQADRLISFAHLYHLMRVLYHEGSVTRQRNFATILWCCAGTLTELGNAIPNLRAALKKRDVLDPESEQWRTLTRVEDTWHKNPHYRRIRNQVAFHVDRSALIAGLRKLAAAKDEPTFFVEADGPENYQVSFRLGRQALAAGIGLDAENHKMLLHFLEECAVVPDALQGAFIDAAVRAGATFKKASVAVSPRYQLAFNLDELSSRRHEQSSD